MNAGPAIAKRSKPNVDPSTMAIGEIIYAANAIESLNGAIRESAKAPDEAVGAAAASGAIGALQHRRQPQPKHLEIDRRGQPHRRVAIFRKPPIPLIRIEKPG